MTSAASATSAIRKSCRTLLPLGVAFAALAPSAHSQQTLQVTEVAGQLPTIQANDLVTGQNKPGPYTLGWNHFLRDLNHSVSVVVDGVTLNSDAYTVDAVKGTVVFAAPLKSTSIARVAYQYDPASAKRNADFMQSPITVPLMHAAGTDLQLTALPDSVSGDGTTRLIYGLNRQTNLMGGGLTSKALIAGTGSSLNFGYKYGSDRNGFDAAFGRTERSFATHFGKPLNLATPNSALSFGGHLRPANFLGLGATQSDTHDLAANTDTTQKGMTLNLGGVKSQPTLNLARVVSVVDTAQKAATDTTTDKADLTAKLGGLTAITAKTQIVGTNAPGEASDATAKDSTVAVATVSKDKKQQASLTLTDSAQQTATADNKNQDIQIKLQPMPVFVLSAEQKDTKSAPAGTATTPTTTDVKTTLGAEVTPLVATKLTGTVSTDVQGDAHIAVKNLNAQVGTGKAVEIGGGITDRSAEATPTNPTPSQTLDTKRATLALRPFKAFTLSGGYTWNPEKDGTVTPAFRQDVGLNARVGALEFGSTYSMTTLNGLNLADSAADPQFGQIAVSLGLRFSRFTSLKGNYQDYLQYGANCAEGGGAISGMPARGSRIYGLNVTHSLGSAFNVSMDGTVTENYAVTNATPAYKAQATIGAKF